MDTHELDLLPNALDSLAEALSKFEDGAAGDTKAYKFAVLHMAHFIELLFKYHLTQKHPLLIYKDPFAQKLDEKSKTITLWEAINFINNEKVSAVSATFRNDLEWLKKLRNEIEHHKFQMDVVTVRTTVGRLFRSVLEFVDHYMEINIDDVIPVPTLKKFKILSDEYEFRLRLAMKEADEREEMNWIDPSDGDCSRVRIDCEDCGNPTLVINADSPTGFRCTFCANEESDNLPATCDICGTSTTVGELTAWETEEGRPVSRCYYCSGYHVFDKDA